MGEILDYFSTVGRLIRSPRVGAAFVVGFNSVSTVEVVIGNGNALPTLPVTMAGNVSMSSVTTAVYTPHAAVQGGADMAGDDCTSGFNVEDKGSGVRGVTTAGHCTAILNVDDINGAPVTTTWQAQHRGSHGDVEWLTTPNAEPAKFHATAVESRDVKGLKSLYFRNDSVCYFGRGTNVRQCDAIHRTSISFTDSDGYVLNEMVVTNLDQASFGDSGCPWSLDNEAIGIHSGSVIYGGVVRNTFSKANHIDNALGVEVRIAP